MAWSTTRTFIKYQRRQDYEPPKYEKEELLELDKYIERVLDAVIFGEEKISGEKTPEIKIPTGTWQPGMAYKRMHVRKSFSSSFIPGFTTRKTEIVELPQAPPEKATRGTLNLLLDASGSMNHTDKMESMKTAGIGLIECAKQRLDLVSVYLFGDEKTTLIEKSRDYTEAQRKLAGIKQCWSRSTQISDSALSALEVAKSVKKATTIIVTDGVIKDLSKAKKMINGCGNYGPVIFIIIEDTDALADIEKNFPLALPPLFFEKITSWQDFAKKVIAKWKSPEVQRKLERY